MLHVRKLATQFLILLTIMSGGFGYSVYPADAQSTSDVDKLKNEINDRSNRLVQIEKEIAGFENQLKQVGSEKNTLKNAIAKLEIERKKVQADIAFTEQKISATNLQIQKLALESKETQDHINDQKEAIAALIRSSNRINQTSFIEVFLQNSSLTDFWVSFDRYLQIQSGMSSKVKELAKAKQDLEDKRLATEDQRGALVDLKNRYSNQSEILVSNKNERTELLVATQSKESEYQKMLAAKKAAREQIDKEMREYETKLKFILDPSTIPAAGNAVFAWPVTKVIITQFFGGTEFAKRNSGVYGGRAYHPGVDFGVPVGTEIHAPLSGVVRATGNTDAVPGCYSWGKWTLIDHANGLSTLYAHQSQQLVTAGQKVNTGDVIGYSGNTGYSTGPHLHFTVYAKDGVSVRQFNQIKSVTSCGAATTPVAATDAYLDPMNYLPKY